MSAVQAAAAVAAAVRNTNSHYHTQQRQQQQVIPINHPPPHLLSTETKTPPVTLHDTSQVGWASTSDKLPAGADTTQPPQGSPKLNIPPSDAARTLPASVLADGASTATAAEGSTGREELFEALSDVEAGMEEILPRDARMALLDYKPGDVVITPTGRGWHVVKVFSYFNPRCGGFWF